MNISNLRKETSERSDAANWAKDLLVKNTPSFYESIEGCNQNASNTITHLLERARFDNDGVSKDLDNILEQIVVLEGKDTLERKINFSKLFSIPLTYCLYCDETESVHLYNLISIEDLTVLQHFTTYKGFSDWIATQKQWKSNKAFRENEGLPNFDKQLRKAGTAWPTNLDCFITDKTNKPLAIIEYQNADRTGVVNHCNNDYLLCKQSYKNNWGHTNYHDDIRRWTSQEILRVQSGLRFFVITWSTINDDYILKEIESIALPYFPLAANGTIDWNYSKAYKASMNEYANTKNAKSQADLIAKGKTFNFSSGIPLNVIVNHPPLSIVNKTFPSLYYKYKKLNQGNKTELLTDFMEIL
jgi:hypothetical protein